MTLPRDPASSADSSADVTPPNGDSATPATTQDELEGLQSELAEMREKADEYLKRRTPPWG
jgi:hypothetical protein